MERILNRAKEPSIAQLEIPAGIIDLGAGQPSPELLPVDMVRGASERCTAGSNPAYLAYGHPQGHGLLRQALARFLSPAYGVPVTSENLLITAGASQALDLICTLFTRPGDSVVVEEPSYFLALRIFADHGLKVVGLPLDHQGLRIDKLEQVLAQTRPSLLYTIPVFHNPAGVTLSAERREALIQLCRHHDLPIVADEVYHLLALGDPPPPPMATHADAGMVFSLGSFSKILSPGLRLGWIHAAPSLAARLADCGLLDSGGGMNPFTAGVVHEILAQGGLDTHLALLKQTYRARMSAMDQALKTELGTLATFQPTQGGYFRWVELSETIDTHHLLSAARARGVAFQPGAKFSSQKRLSNYLRLSWAYYSESDLAQGVQRLRQIL
ncbi:MAG: PLP-dependent aminotransferase family protein [Desulfobacterales bacterium]